MDEAGRKRKRAAKPRRQNKANSSRTIFKEGFMFRFGRFIAGRVCLEEVAINDQVLRVVAPGIPKSLAPRRKRGRPAKHPDKRLGPKSGGLQNGFRKVQRGRGEKTAKNMKIHRKKVPEPPARAKSQFKIALKPKNRPNDVVKANKIFSQPIGVGRSGRPIKVKMFPDGEVKMVPKVDGLFKTRGRSKILDGLVSVKRKRIVHKESGKSQNVNGRISDKPRKRPRTPDDAVFDNGLADVVIVDPPPNPKRKPISPQRKLISPQRPLPPPAPRVVFETRYYLKMPPKRYSFHQSKLTYDFTKLAAAMYMVKLPAPNWKVRVWVRNNTTTTAICVTNNKALERSVTFLANSAYYKLVVDGVSVILLGSPTRINSVSDIEVLVAILDCISLADCMVLKV